MASSGDNGIAESLDQAAAALAEIRHPVGAWLWLESSQVVDAAQDPQESSLLQPAVHRGPAAGEQTERRNAHQCGLASHGSARADHEVGFAHQRAAVDRV